MMSEQDFAIVATIQQRFHLAGWRWSETTFHDKHGHNDVYLRFSPSRNPHAFSIGDLSDYDERRYGWGRFPRVSAWRQAEAFLLDEDCSADKLVVLKQYKARWGVS